MLLWRTMHNGVTVLDSEPGVWSHSGENNITNPEIKLPVKTFSIMLIHYGGYLANRIILDHSDFPIYSRPNCAGATKCAVTGLFRGVLDGCTCLFFNGTTTYDIIIIIL